VPHGRFGRFGARHRSCEEIEEGPEGARHAGDVQETVVELYVRNDSESCRQAVATAEDFAKQRAGLRIVVRDVLADQEALRRYWQLVKQNHLEKPVMPGVSCGVRFDVGFSDAAAFRTELEELLSIRVYTREGCPHCRDAKRFLADLATRRPALRVTIYDVVRDSAARRQMEELAAKHSARVTGLPVIAAAGRLIVGYQTDAVTGKRIESLFAAPVSGPVDADRKHAAVLPRAGGPAAALAYLKAWVAVGSIRPASLVLQVGDPSGDLPPPPPTDLPPPPPPGPPVVPSAVPEADEPSAEQIELPYFGTLHLRDWGLPLFTLLVGLVDGFNPCAMWVLVFLLSVLVNVRSRARILAVAGTFVLISGLAYFAFMAAWLNIFVLLGIIRPLQIALGCVALGIGVLNVKDFFAFHRGPSLSIPESAKPGIYDRVRRIVSARSLPVAVSAAVVLAIMVNTVELLCTAGLPALYGEILTLQQLPWWKNYAYLGLYIAAYMFDDSLLLTGFVLTLSRRKLQEQHGRVLKLLSGVVILSLGTAMIFKPQWLHFSN